MTDTKAIVRSKRGIVLHVGCGREPQPGAVGMDARPHENVDVVWDHRDLPWPFDDESALTIIATHAISYVDPAGDGFVRWMNEAWRVLKPRGQLALVTAYAGGPLWWMDPGHCNGVNERTWLFFDPEHTAGVYAQHEPAPWSVEQNMWQLDGSLEVVLRKRPDVADYHADGTVHFKSEVAR